MRKITWFGRRASLDGVNCHSTLIDWTLDVSKQPPQSLPPPPLFTRLLSFWQHVPIRLQIHLIQPHPPRPLQQFPSHIHDQHDGQLDVERHETHAVEARAETAPALDEDEDTVQNDGCVGAERVSPVPKGKEVCFALESKSGAETDGGDSDRDPAQLVGYADDVLKPRP